eukprot:14862578-Alexandrium_andersonii.AAC.1
MHMHAVPIWVRKSLAVPCPQARPQPCHSPFPVRKKMKKTSSLKEKAREKAGTGKKEKPAAKPAAKPSAPDKKTSSHKGAIAASSAS